MAKAMDQMFAYREALIKAGAFIDTAPLAMTPEARTLRHAEGELQVTDGPYAETREQLSGYFIIEAESTALQWAARCPAARCGAIEVRPFNQWPPA